jgi:hypothetical protein
MNGWDKLKAVAGAASAVVIPVVLLVVGNNYSAAIKQREIESQFVELAVAILTEEPAPETENLRTWATEVINRYSGVQLPEQTRRDLIDRVRLTASPGIAISRTQTTAGFTDFSLFVCEAAAGDPEAQRIADATLGVLEGLQARGEVSVQTWGGALYEEISLDELRGKLTIVVDRDHPERMELARIREALANRPGLPPVAVVDNRGEETPWRISLIVCP